MKVTGKNNTKKKLKPDPDKGQNKNSASKKQKKTSQKSAKQTSATDSWTAVSVKIVDASPAQPRPAPKVKNKPEDKNKSEKDSNNEFLKEAIQALQDHNQILKDQITAQTSAIKEQTQKLEEFEKTRKKEKENEQAQKQYEKDKKEFDNKIQAVEDAKENLTKAKKQRKRLRIKGLLHYLPVLAIITVLALLVPKFPKVFKSSNKKTKSSIERTKFKNALSDVNAKKQSQNQSDNKLLQKMNVNPSLDWSHALEKQVDGRIKAEAWQDIANGTEDAMSKSMQNRILKSSELTQDDVTEYRNTYEAKQNELNGKQSSIENAADMDADINPALQFQYELESTNQEVAATAVEVDQTTLEIKSISLSDTGTQLTSVEMTQTYFSSNNLEMGTAINATNAAGPNAQARAASPSSGGGMGGMTA